MQSFLVIGSTIEKRNEWITHACEEDGIDPIDRQYIEREILDEKAKASLGIEQVKKLQQTLYLTPIHSKGKAVCILEADLLTTEAQNALLKVLEEPPRHVIFCLSGTTQEAFLPTIRSRCKIVSLSSEKVRIDEKDEQAFKDILEALQRGNISHPFELAESVGKGREEAIVWLEKLLRVLHSSLQEKAMTNSTAIPHLWETYKTIKSTNANHRLVLENFFLTYAKQ